jgi:hypothetical protein
VDVLSVAVTATNVTYGGSSLLNMPYNSTSLSQPLVAPMTSVFIVPPATTSVVSLKILCYFSSPSTSVTATYGNYQFFITRIA